MLTTIAAAVTYTRLELAARDLDQAQTEIQTREKAREFQDSAHTDSRVLTSST